MKINNIKDSAAFFKMLDSCSGKVELVTGEGDRLNLKSKLSQYVALAKVLDSGAIPEMELIAYDREDTLKIIEFMTNQE